MAWLVTLPSHIWDALSLLTELSSSELQSECIAAGHIAFHFFWRRVLEPAGQLPWCLCRGDINQNLEELMEEEEPEEPVSRKIWELLHRDDVPRAQVVAGIKLLGQCPWTTLPCEQMHGSLAVFRKWHPDFGVSPLLSRAFMLQFSRIAIPDITKAEKELAKTSKLIHKIMEKNPDKATGTSQLYADIQAAMQGSDTAGEGAEEAVSGPAKAQQIFPRAAA
eukprot:4117610-Lingulodinium_polyedra.AAC.1